MDGREEESARQIIWLHRAVFTETQGLPDKIRLISLYNQDPLPRSTGLKWKEATKSLFLAIFYGRLIVAVLFLGVPVTTNAGVISFITKLFNPADKIEMTASVANSQTVDLLESTVNSDPLSARGGGDITIVGGSALLPESGPSGTLADLGDSSQSDQISIYIVHKGDSLTQIAKMFNVSVNTIAWANDLKNGVIREGQTLIILPVSGVSHVVKTGDTLKSIVKKYKADLGEVLRFNNLKEDSVLAVGTAVIIPDAELAPVNLGLPKKIRGTGGPDLGEYYLRPILGGRKTQGLHGYNGVDLAAPTGNPVFASASGDVIISKNYGWNGGYGNYIVINHPNGTQTLYSHLSENVVFQGSYVVRGQVIGYVGSTGNSTGPHVHFEVRGAKNPF